LRYRIPPAAPERIAVIPFTATGSDSALLVFGDQLSAQLQSKLDDDRRWDAVNMGYASMSETGAEVPLSLSRAALLARRVGAASYVVGSVRPSGSEVSVSWSVGRLDSSQVVSDSARILVKDSTAAIDSIKALLDRMSKESRAQPRPH
jgi:hypothetical protein